MSYNPIRAAGTVIKVDGVVVARVTQARETSQLEEADVTGVENISGDLVQEQFISVSIGTTLQLSGILLDGTDDTEELEPGQLDLRAKMRAGTQVVLSSVKPEGYGSDLTGYLTQWEEGFDNAKAVYTFTAQMRVNSRAAVTP